MHTDKKKVGSDPSKKESSNKDAMKEGFMFGLGGGFRGVQLLKKVKENNPDNSGKDYFIAILTLIGLSILVIILVAIFF